MHEPFAALAQRLGGLSAAHSLRRLRKPLALADRPLVNFGSNDYLGLAQRPLAGSVQSARGAGASPLVCGHSAAHAQLCDLLAQLEQTEAAVLFASGYAACSGTLATLPQVNDLILSDQLNHASLIDGCRLSPATKMIYRHGDAAEVEALLAQHRASFRGVWIVTDGVFSMDGDLAPLRQLCDLAERYDASVIVDEAHGTGVLGDDGSGTCAHLGVKSRVPIRIGTLSKAIGAQGGFVAGPQVVIDYLINFCRPLIYSTAASPLVVQAAIEGLRAIDQEPQRRRRVRALAKRVRSSLGWSTGDDGGDEVPIIPVQLGSNRRALEAGRRAEQSGMFIPAIRPPTVPEGTSRLRISLTAAHSDAEVDALIDFLQAPPESSL